MKCRLRSVDDHGTKYQALQFWCPGCEGDDGNGGLHMLPVVLSGESPTDGRATWTFNGDLDNPTLSPSVLTTGGRVLVCHSFLVDGVFQFLGDCTHSLAGQHVPIPDLPAWVAKERE